ncbi:hypothetical protein [Actinocrispum sp. NPDC049592]|uniref:hypothetical protein n=1 Tax=Actinocrispum sp. NPDC049592 TaxID=3154835 RepID=UPI0034279359
MKECLAAYADWLWREATEGSDLDTEYRAAVGQDGVWQDSGAVGPLMLHALRRTVGDEPFFRTLQFVVANQQFAPLSLGDFERLACQESGVDLTGFFTAWARSGAIPATQYLFPGPLYR